MATKDKRVDAYIAASEDFAKPILKHLRKLVHAGCPEIQEVIKWGFPHFEYQGLVCSMAAFKQHCAFGFWKASLLEDYEKKLLPQEETAMGHFGKISSLKELPPDKTLLKYIKEARRLNEESVKITKPKPAVRKALVVPDYFKKALASDKKAKATFDAFPYSQKKEYTEWLSEAKTEVTRSKRINTAMEWLAEGKRRNWKYER